MDVVIQAHIKSKGPGLEAKKKKTADMTDCYICNEMCLLEKMRTDVGQHKETSRSIKNVVIADVIHAT